MTRYVVIGFSGGRHWICFYSCATKKLLPCFYRLCFGDFCRAITNFLAHIWFLLEKRWSLGFGITQKIFLHWSKDLIFLRKTALPLLSKAHFATLNRCFKTVTWCTVPDTFPDAKKDFLQCIALTPHRYAKNCWSKEISEPMQVNNLLFPIWFHIYWHNCKGSARIRKGSQTTEIPEASMPVNQK